MERSNVFEGEGNGLYAVNIL